MIVVMKVGASPTAVGGGPACFDEPRLAGMAQRWLAEEHPSLCPAHPDGRQVPNPENSAGTVAEPVRVAGAVATMLAAAG